MKKTQIHRTAEISPNVVIGNNTKIWRNTHIRENAIIGSDCIIGRNVYIDRDIKIGSKCKIQDNCSIYYQTIIEDAVFLGPHVIITNDKNPRATNEEGNIKSPNEWKTGKVLIKQGASIGAGSIILPNITIGKFAMIGAGSVVTRNVPDFALIYGNPARIYGKVNKSGDITKKVKNV